MPLLRKVRRRADRRAPGSSASELLSYNKLLNCRPWGDR